MKISRITALGRVFRVYASQMVTLLLITGLPFAKYIITYSRGYIFAKTDYLVTISTGIDSMVRDARYYTAKNFRYRRAVDGSSRRLLCVFDIVYHRKNSLAS